jgi:hypothetical protein
MRALRTITGAVALSCTAVALFPGTAWAKGPPCPPGGPIEASATFKPQRERVPDAHNEFVARVTVRQDGAPVPGLGPSVGLVRIGTEHPGGYLYFPRQLTNADGVAWVAVTVPRRGRWRYRLHACSDARVEQSGLVPADGPPASPPPAPTSADRGGAPAGDGESWALWLGVAGALGAAAVAALMLSARARARA